MAIMKAAVIYQQGAAPIYAEMPEPQPVAGETIVAMKAVAIASNERSIAQGTHYSARPLANPEIPGRMGVGLLPDGSRVAGIYLGGSMLAEKALMKEGWMTPLPDSIDDITAAALLNAVIGSATAMIYRAEMQAGEIVLVHGATGFTGALAVQLAKLYGAVKVIATGRNKARLSELQSLGADELISLDGNDDIILTKLKAAMDETPVNVVLDYTWGHPAALLLKASEEKGPMRYVSIGATAGDHAAISSEVLRSTDIRIMGSGQGSLGRDAVHGLFTRILPQVFEWAASGKLIVNTRTSELKDVEAAFYRQVPAGHRLVITI